MPAAITLTDESIKSIKPSAGRQMEYPDAKVAGLALRVSASGTKSWTFRYRTATGQQRRLKLGTYPATGLATARSRARAALNEAEAGGDPAGDRRKEKAKARLRQVATVAELAEDYFLAAKVGRHRPNTRAKRASTMDLERDYFDRLIKPKFGCLAVADLKRAEFQRFLDVAGKTSPSAARQCRNVVRQMYNFAIRREITDKNPAQFGEVPVPTSRDRVLTDAEIKAIWQAAIDPEGIEGLSLSPGMGLAIRLAMVTLQRGGEICGLHSSELDLEVRIWTIPSERTKNHRVHVVPLSDSALQLIKSALATPRPHQDAGSEPPKERFLFPSPRGGGPITRHALSRAMKRITTAVGIEDATPHDFRRTGSTHLTSERLAVPRFHVSCVLNHISDEGGAAAVTAVYDRNAYLAEKRRALDKWASRLAQIVGESDDTANILQLR
jgi:integrase